MKLQFANSINKFGGVLLLSLAAAFVMPVAVDKAFESVGFDSQLVEDANAQSTRAKRKLPGISESFFKKLGKISDLASPPEEENRKPDFQGAIKALKKMEKDCGADKCNEYEKAQIYNYFGWIYYSVEDYNNSIKYYELVVNQAPHIPWGLELQVMYTLVQLEFSQERYSNALKRLDQWMKLSETIGADVYNLRASICYQMDDKNCALKSIKTAVKMVEDKGKVAKEAWYSLERALYLEKEDYKSSLPVLVKLVRHYPKHSYYQQMGSVYGMLEKEKSQLAILDSTYIMGGLAKEQQLLNLSYLMIQSDYPYRAAKILDKGIKGKVIKRSEKNLETLAKAWGMSQEKKKAIPYMTEAAKLSKKGDLYGVLMGLYLDVDDSKSAIKAGRDAIKKGELKRPGEINLNIGIAYFELKNFDDSIKYLKKAAKYEKTQRFALRWIKHVEREQARAEQLAAS